MCSYCDKPLSIWGIIIPTILVRYSKPWVLSFASCLVFMKASSIWINLLAMKSILLFVFLIVVFIWLISCKDAFAIDIIPSPTDSILKSNLFYFSRRICIPFWSFWSLFWAIYALKPSYANEIKEETNLLCLDWVFLFIELDLLSVMSWVPNGASPSECRWWSINDSLLLEVVGVCMCKDLLLLSVMSLLWFCCSTASSVFCIKVLLSLAFS